MTQWMDQVTRGWLMYDLGDHLLMVTSDRISAFEVVMDALIPAKIELPNCSGISTNMATPCTDWAVLRVRPSRMKIHISEAPNTIDAITSRGSRFMKNHLSPRTPRF